jgi:hypothetical protein
MQKINMALANGKYDFGFADTLEMPSRHHWPVLA